MHDLTPSGTAPPLVAAIIGLAGLPDGSTAVDEHLDRIVRLTAALVPEARYASVTRLLEQHPTTVALSDEVAGVLDEAQHSAGGPCMTTLADGVVREVDLVRTVEWPEFRQKASALGLRGTLSVPLTSARGETLAALNVHGVDQGAMAALSRRVWSALAGSTAELDLPRPHRTDGTHATGGTDGAGQLVAGLVQAREVTAMVRTAVCTMATSRGVGEEEAYELLRRRAIGQGSSVLRTAIEVAERALP